MTRVLMVRHRHRPNAMTSAVSLTEALNERGIEVVDDASLGGIDMVLSIGGDGTFLVAASSARALDVPLLGINAGHMIRARVISHARLPMVTFRSNDV